MLNLLTEIALADANDPSIVERVINVSDTFEEATSFGYDNEYTRIEVQDKQSLPYKVKHEILMIGLPTSNVNVANLEHFADPNNDTVLAILGTDQVAVCQDSVKCEFIEKPDVGRAWKFKITFETVPYRDDTGRKGAGFHLGSNLMSIYSWADDDGDGYPNGFTETETGAVVATFSNGELDLDVGDTEELLLEFEDIFFPYNGVQLTASVDVNDYTNSGAQSVEVSVDILDDTGAVIGTETITIGSTGRKSTTFTLPSGTSKIRFYVDMTGGTGDKTLKLANPAIQLGSDSEYKPY